MVVQVVNRANPLINVTLQAYKGIMPLILKKISKKFNYPLDKISTYAIIKVIK